MPRVKARRSPPRHTVVYHATMLTRKLLALVFPEGLLLLTAVALTWWGADSAAAEPILRLYPLVVLGVGGILTWRFQRGRLLLALAALTLAALALSWLAPPESAAAHADDLTVRVVAILLPVTLATLGFMPERGPLSIAGLRRLALLATEVAVALAASLLAVAYPLEMHRVLDVALLPAPLLTWAPVGQLATLVSAGAIIALAGRTLWRGDAESRGFLWAAVGGLTAVSAGPEHGRSTLYLASAGMVLVVATVESVYAMAYHDELTGLPARRALNEALQRAAGTYTVAMVDVDHFKQFNDTHGHDVGDQVLRMVAGRLGGVTGGGRAYRYGGEEFAVLFAGKGASEAGPHLEALREAVAGARFTLRGKDRPKKKPAAPRSRGERVKPLAVTVSIGAAQSRAASTPDGVVKAADKALYRAKEAGRNRVELQ